MIHKWSAICLVLAALAVTACGGGGGSGSIDDPGTGPGDVTPESDAELLVLNYDQDGDGLTDVVTVDTSETPFVIVEALRGVADGGTLDVTSSLAGHQIDTAISEALSAYLGDAIDVASEADLDLSDSNGNAVTVTVYE